MKQVKTTIEGLKKWGFVPVEGKYVCPDTRTLDELIEDLDWALSDPDIQAIFCVRGGYGATEVMDNINPDKIKEADKPIIGYSDITVYHSAWTKAGLPSIHSGMSAARGGKFTSVADMIQKEFLTDMSIPVAFDFPAGHGNANYPLLMGEKIELNVNKENFEIKFAR